MQTLVRRADISQELTWSQMDSNWSLIQAAIASLEGALVYRGTWNAASNTPTLVSGGSGVTKGTYYKVSVTGSTPIDGISQWNVGDIIAYNGLVWDKIDGLANEVVTVAGRTGAVTLAVADISGAAPINNPTFTGTVVSPTFSGSGSLLTDIPNGALSNSSVTVGTTNIALGATSLILGGLTSVTATNFIGSGASLTSIPNGALVNNSLTLGSTNVALGTTAISLSGFTSITSTAFIGALTGTASIASKALHLDGGNNTTLLGSIPYQSGTDITVQLAPNTTAVKMFLAQTGTGVNGAIPVWSNIVSADLTTALTTPPAIGATTPSTGKFTTVSHTQKSNFTAYANTPALGDLWYDSVQQTFASSEGISSNIATTYKPGVLAIARSTSAVTFAAATTDYQILTSTTIGTLTLPIGGFVVGKTASIKVNGVITIVTTASTVTSKITIGSTVITFPVSASLTAGSYNFTLDLDLTTITTGASGTCIGMGRLIIATQGASTVFSYGTVNIPVSTTINTTVTNAIGCSFQTASATTSSTVLADNAIVTLLG